MCGNRFFVANPSHFNDFIPIPIWNLNPIPIFSHSSIPKSLPFPFSTYMCVKLRNWKYLPVKRSRLNVCNVGNEVQPRTLATDKAYSTKPGFGALSPVPLGVEGRWNDDDDGCGTVFSAELHTLDISLDMVRNKLKTFLFLQKRFGVLKSPDY